MNDLTRNRSLIAIAALPLALAACEVAPPEENRDEPGEPAGFGQPGQDSGSIMRPDVEQGKAAERPEALAPLRITLGFPDGGNTLSEAALATLAEFLASEQVAAGGAITVTGHTDSAGSDASNFASSAARAEAVAKKLTEKGIAEERITVVALGEQNPILPNAKEDGSPNEVGRAANRRVDLRATPPKKTPEPQEQS